MMNPPWLGMIRLSPSVKLDSRSDRPPDKARDRPDRSPPGLPVTPSPSRMCSRRRCLFAIRCGVSSPRRCGPCWASSALSATSARAFTLVNCSRTKGARCRAANSPWDPVTRCGLVPRCWSAGVAVIGDISLSQSRKTCDKHMTVCISCDFRITLMLRCSIIIRRAATIYRTSKLGISSDDRWSI
jgi:hypothetical protein